MYSNNRFSQLISLLHQRPHAMATIRGSQKYPDISGSVRFYQNRQGILTAAELRGLPMAESPCGNSFFGFHIHSGGSCSGSGSDPFADALAHFNPENCPHPSHAGDLPPLLSCGGYACQLFLTDRFTISDIIGRTVIVHSQPDDFRTQPSGNAGEKMACGVIRSWDFLS